MEWRDPFACTASEELAHNNDQLDQVNTNLELKKAPHNPIIVLWCLKLLSYGYFGEGPDGAGVRRNTPALQGGGGISGDA